MDLKERATAIADELNVDFDKIHMIIGISKDQFEAACNGDEAALNKATQFLEERETAFSTYESEQVSALKEFEKTIPTAGSQRNAAEKVGIGSAVISQMRRGKYIGRSEKYFAALIEYFKIKSEKSELPSVYVPVDYAPTTISQMIYERLRNVHVIGGCAVITGDSGIGKTKTIQKYAKDNRTKTIVITASVFNHTATDVLYMLAAELGISDNNKRRVKNAIFSKLHDGMIIIVDEAQELTYQAEHGSREDAFHQLVYGLTGKESVKTLTEQEARRVDRELNKRLRADSVPGMITNAQRSQVWRLMYKLSDLSPSKVSIAERLAGAVRNILGITASSSDPLLWVSKSDASRLIARLEKYVASAQRKQAKHDESG